MPRGKRKKTDGRKTNHRPLHFPDEGVKITTSLSLSRTALDYFNANGRGKIIEALARGKETP